MSQGSSSDFKHFYVHFSSEQVSGQFFGLRIFLNMSMSQSSSLNLQHIFSMSMSQGSFFGICSIVEGAGNICRSFLSDVYI